MAFKENLLRKIEIDRLASQVAASCGTIPGAGHRIAREPMRQLLACSTFRYQRQRDLDLYVKPAEDGRELILVLDNELPIFHATVEDVVVRRSPRTLEMWNFRTIRRILVDTDIRICADGESVATVRRDALAQLDLTYADADIRDLALDGATWLAEGRAEKVEEILALFAALLDLARPPKGFGLDETVSFGVVVSGDDGEVCFGPLVLYRPAGNTLAWIDRPLARSDREQMRFLREAASGTAAVPVRRAAVFDRLAQEVLARPQRQVGI